MRSYASQLKTHTPPLPAPVATATATVPPTSYTQLVQEYGRPPPFLPPRLCRHLLNVLHKEGLVDLDFCTQEARHPPGAC